MQKIVDSAFECHQQQAIADIATHIIRKLERIHIRVGHPAVISLRYVKSDNRPYPEYIFKAEQNSRSSNFIALVSAFDNLPNGVHINDITDCMKKIWLALQPAPQFELISFLIKEAGVSATASSDLEIRLAPGRDPNFNKDIVKCYNATSKDSFYNFNADHFILKAVPLVEYLVSLHTVKDQDADQEEQPSKVLKHN